MIAEPTLEQYHYYLRRLEDDDPFAAQAHQEVFRADLMTLFEHIGRLLGHSVPLPDWPVESQKRHISQRLIHTGWLDHLVNGRSYFIDARTYSDVYWLQVGYSQAGQAEPDIFARLQEETWQPSAQDHLLGSSNYLCGIVAENKAAAVAQAIEETDWRYTRLVFYPDEDTEKVTSRVLLNDIAPRLELYKHKVDRQLGWCEHQAPVLDDQARSLRFLLTQIMDETQAELAARQRLIPLQRVFTTNLGLLAQRKITIETNLDNLDFVLNEAITHRWGDLLTDTRNDLARRFKQFEVDLRYANQTREQVETVIDTYKIELSAWQTAGLQENPTDQRIIEPKDDDPGWITPIEAEIEPLQPHQKSQQPVTFPQIFMSPSHPGPALSPQDEALLQRVYRHLGQVLIEQELGNGLSGSRIFLVQPIDKEGIPTLQEIIKLGDSGELREERENHRQHVENYLHQASHLQRDRYIEQDNRAALGYRYVGNGILGETRSLEAFYLQCEASHASQQLASAIKALLEKDAGEHWYSQTSPLSCFFEVEYGPHLIEQLRLRLRPNSEDTLWIEAQPNTSPGEYRQISVSDITRDYPSIASGEFLQINGLVVTKIREGVLKLQDPDGRGVTIRVELPPKSPFSTQLQQGQRVGVRGEVVYNRHTRMKQIASWLFPEFQPYLDGAVIPLPGSARKLPNAMLIYPQLLGGVLRGYRSRVHGDLHLRNVIIDEKNSGWLIDFAKVKVRHNLFDFIKLETYIRLWILSRYASQFSVEDYIQFECALNDTTLGKMVKRPGNPHLEFAFDIICDIRATASKYINAKADMLHEFFPALCLYHLAMMKYYQHENPQPIRLSFITACVLGLYIQKKNLFSEDLGSSSAPIQTTPTNYHGWAVLAGVNTYHDPAISNLSLSCADVQAVHSLLADPGSGKFHCRLLLEEQPETQPMRNNILAELTNAAQVAGEQDLLLFYFTGHGVLDSGEAYLVPCDARIANLQDTAIPMRRVKDIIMGSNARAKIMLLDACHSGAQIGKAGAHMNQGFIQRVFEEAEGLAILASCQQGQVSYEWHDKNQSVFTYYLLEGLAGAADFDHKGFVTIQDVHRYVVDQVKVWSLEHGHIQVPTLGGGWSGDIIITRPPANRIS